MIKQICDFCGKETDYIQINLPITVELKDRTLFWHGHKIPYNFKSYDICERCMRKLVKAIEDLKEAQ